ncbi:MAG: hypothetical protein QOH86_1538 [Sphingomonadales bacterium]|jgi:hypothetical protein|nr:hypothetical protein [Sphingomonadales bacterium]
MSDQAPSDGAFRIEGPEGVAAGNGDLLVVTPKGTPVALVYRGFGPGGQARQRAEAIVAVLTGLEAKP